MSDPPNRIAADLFAPDDNTRRFHAGPNHQMGIPTDPELSAEEVELLEADRARIKVPVAPARWGYDEDGNPIEPPPQGLVFDAETGAVRPIEVDEVQPVEAADRPETSASKDEAVRSSPSGSSPPRGGGTPREAERTPKAGGAG
jgi:hypothetical protein